MIKNDLNLYACLLRKYYIGEEDYMYITLSKISNEEINKSWKYALIKIKHEERTIKSIDIRSSSWQREAWKASPCWTLPRLSR